MKIKFVDGLENQNELINSIIGKLREKQLPIEIGDNPDIIFYTDFSDEHIYYDCIRIYISRGDVHPDFNVCDYGVSNIRMKFDDRYLCIDDDYSMEKLEDNNQFLNYLVSILMQPIELMPRRCNVYISEMYQIRKKNLANYNKFFKKLGVCKDNK